MKVIAASLVRLENVKMSCRGGSIAFLPCSTRKDINLRTFWCSYFLCVALFMRTTREIEHTNRTCSGSLAGWKHRQKRSFKRTWPIVRTTALGAKTELRRNSNSNCLLSASNFKARRSEASESRLRSNTSWKTLSPMSVSSENSRSVMDSGGAHATAKTLPNWNIAVARIRWSIFIFRADKSRKSQTWDCFYLQINFVVKIYFPAEKVAFMDLIGCQIH